MRDILAAIGAGSLFFSTVLVLLGVIHERADRQSRDRQRHDAESVAHIRRFTAAMRVLDLDEYRRRKANACSASQVAPQASRSVAEAASPRAESITTIGVSSNG